MGCDIHGVIQINKKGIKDGIITKEWETVAEGYGSRNYAIFSILANVRNYFEKPWAFISEPKGFPRDFIIEGDYHPLPDSFKWDSWDGNVYQRRDNKYWMGDHSYSHLTAQELIDYDWENIMKRENSHNILGSEDFCYFIISISKYAFKYGAENVRFVFGFDN